MILNFFFDFILLLSVCILLKRKVSVYRLLMGSFIGGISILFLFINVSSLQLFLFKILISIVMLLVTFKYKSFIYTFKNFIYLYSASMILGGFLYFLNIEFSYKKIGIVFINQGLSINFIFLVLFAPFIIYIYIKQGKWLKNNYNNYYNITIIYNNKSYDLTAFLDTGNNLIDPITLKPVILIDKQIKCDKFFYIPYKVVNNKGLIKCFKADKVIINNKVINKVIVGIMNDKIKMDGINCLLNKKLLEEIC
jgi:stage II sporulation protein GA (sporulation sigma-E factor processing peptidase)